MTRRALREYVTAYLDEVGSLRYADISSVQPAPYGSLARGAGGIVYLLARLGHPRAARRWLSALRADRRRAAYQYGGLEFPRSSIMYGRAGVYWLAARVEREPERAASAYARLAPLLQNHEIMRGAAGYLTGARILLAHAPHAQLGRAAASVALSLQLQARDARPWIGGETKDAAGFAMGWPGVLHSLLAWSEHVGEALPDWVIPSLRTLAETWSPARPRFMATWCNGATGMTLLWSKAFACTQDEQFLDAARRMATLAISVEDVPSFLCCGLAGVASSLLELDRVDPDRGWSELAFQLGVRAVSLARRVPLEWPNGLYNGHPGIVCLAAELVGASPPGFPVMTT